MATTEGLDPSFAAKVRALVAASGGRVTIVSGKRSVERQAQLWSAALRKYGSAAAARKWVAPPGRSRHNHGTAVDLGGDLALAAKLAPQFGLHRPLKNEAWHFEPMGSRSGSTASGSSSTTASTKTTEAAYAHPDEDINTDPGINRHDLGVQLSTFIDIFEAPIDFTQGKVA